MRLAKAIAAIHRRVQQTRGEPLRGGSDLSWVDVLGRITRCHARAAEQSCLQISMSVSGRKCVPSSSDSSVTDLPSVK